MTESDPPSRARKRNAPRTPSRKSAQHNEGRLLQTILDTVAVGVAQLRDRRFVWVNPAFCRIFGVAEKDVLGATTERFYPSRSDFEAFGKDAYPGLARGEVFQTERLMRRGDGALRWMWMIGRAVDPGDEEAGSIWALEDIHDLRTAEEALRQSEARYRSLIESLPDIVYSFVPATGERYYSPQVESLFGLTPEQLSRQREFWYDAIHPDDRLRVESLVERSHVGSAFELEYRVRDRDGRWRWLRDRARTRMDNSGTLVLDGIATDITAMKETEIALRERDELLRKLSERVPGVIYQFRMDPQGGMSFSFVSDGARAVFGVEPGVVRERADEMLGRLHPDDYKRVMETIAESYEKLTPWRCEFRGQHPQRGVRWLQGESLPERLEDGSVLWHGYINDVTERKQAEQSMLQSERRYRALFDVNPSPMWVYDTETLQFIEVNQAAVEHYGYRREEFRRMTIRDIRPQEDLPRLAANIAALQEEGIDRAGVWRHRKKNGEMILVEIRSKLIDFGGRRAEIVVALDVTQRLQAEEELRLAAKVFDGSRQAIVITDTRPGIVRVNRAFEEITGYTEAEVLGRNPSMLSSGRQDAEFYRTLWRQLETQGFWEGELWNRRKSGELYPEYLSISAVGDGKGAVAHYVALFSDISERMAAQERIQYLAHHDVLTGLPNRILLRDRVDVALAHARREKTGLALLYMDLDRFKLINDSLGHEVGDELLRQVAERIASQVRTTDTLCRQGGDEFILMLTEVGEMQDAGRIAEKLIAAVGRPFSIRGHELLVTLSIGIAAYPENGEDLESLQRNADSAMYAAKGAGRNTYRYYSPEMNARALEYLSTERDLRRAIEREELFLVCQPQVGLRDGRLVGYEVLVRWQHPVRGLIQPGTFIQIAEESGLIVPMGTWILRQACRERRRFETAGLSGIPVAVNVSAWQFGQPEFVDVVAEILASEGLAPSLLELEVTEGVIMQGSEAVLESLHRLDGMGIRLAIDDFGIGYSSLSYLSSFPIRKLKIDQSFVRDVPMDAGDAAIAQAIIGLGQALGMTVIAEGVETAGQAEFLSRHGCDEVQGFYFGRPVAADAFLALALQWDRQARFSA
jgi:diguanylate cyclase (GGDEF)-like protein/PAS domain S-box-containing protein